MNQHVHRHRFLIGVVVNVGRLFSLLTFAILKCSYGVRFDGPYGPDHMIAGLAKEVEKRMTNVGVKGSQITLKIKQRKPDAGPPPKFLGHGKCFNLSRSQTTPGSISTREGKIIGAVAMKMLLELKIPVEDIRGMGITVSKLTEDSNLKQGVHVNEQRTIETWFSASRATTVLADNGVQGIGSETLDSSNRESVADHEELGECKIDKYSFAAQTIDIDGIDLTDDEHDNDDVVILDPDDVPGARRVAVRPDPTPVDDIVLPAFSQIHMSQVKALPMEMQCEIKSRIQRARDIATHTPAVEDFVPAQLFQSHPRRETFKQSDRQQIEIRQNEIKTVKRANNSKTQIKHHHVRIDYTAASDPIKFFQLDMQPLNDYMDTHSPSSENDEAIKYVSEFLALVMEEDRVSDAIIMLRNIRKRKDSWNTIAYENIYHSLNHKFEIKFGFSLDPEYIE
jgi:impB/mucB/samB family C-terminal domain